MKKKSNFTGPDKLDPASYQQDRRRLRKDDRGDDSFDDRLQDGFDMLDEDDPPEGLPPEVTGRIEP